MTLNVSATTHATHKIKYWCLNIIHSTGQI